MQVVQFFRRERFSRKTILENEPSLSAGTGGGIGESGSDDLLRSNVEHQFLQMSETHDRIRGEFLKPNQGSDEEFSETDWPPRVA